MHRRTELEIQLDKDKEAAQNNRLDALKRALDNDKYSDLVIECRDPNTAWLVRRCEVCPHVPFMDAICDVLPTDGESTFHMEGDPTAINAMIYYCYLCDYSDEPSNANPDSTTDLDPLMLNFLVFELADDYQIPKLSKLAINKFRVRAKDEWGTAAFVDVTRAAFTAKTRFCDRSTDNTNVDDAFRNMMVEITLKHRMVLLKNQEPGTRFYEVCHSTPALNGAVGAETGDSGRKRKRSDWDEGVRLYPCRWCTRTQSGAQIRASIYDQIHFCPTCNNKYPKEVWFRKRASDLDSDTGYSQLHARDDLSSGFESPRELDGEWYYDT
ncbi:hypothetical protein LTR56_011897 [Elasticomyces elasticus]|nr:hypothetical protein LTR56_011897 [Elasticomyces elasticus]KAK3654833.1 hypothetical protein LTR22_010601 [Elasticomyces elasticus]KAK4920646.1 hypothetical protein LTR49_011895 [Elasticomyces elasticus]KAK5759328.1 hypothetical protein LTS12_010491 [Elasticomyces elasticus]